MRAARKLRIVEGCPQPDPPPFKPIQYGFAGGHKLERLPASPLPHEANIIARAMSIRWHYNREVPSVEEAQRIIAADNRPKRVTVPKPLREPSRAAPVDSPPGASPNVEPQTWTASGNYPEGETK
jgi:hypothetical protein